MNSHTKLLIGLVVFLSICCSVVALVKYDKSVVERAAKRAVEMLQRDYSPSPYGPGIDPDKLDLEKIRKLK